jgi:hypothetical protein
MTPTELERHIAECRERMERAQAMYEISHAFSDKGDADFWRLSMEAGIEAKANLASSHAKIA